MAQLSRGERRGKEAVNSCWFSSHQESLHHNAAHLGEILSLSSAVHDTTMGSTSAPVLEFGNSALGRWYARDDARHQVQDALLCPTTPQRASHLANSLPLTPSTPGHVDEGRSIAQLRHDVVLTTPPFTPPSNDTRDESGERPLKRQRLERVPQVARQLDEDVQLDDAYAAVFLTDCHDDEASLSLSCGASPEPCAPGASEFVEYISGYVDDETGRAEENEANYILTSGEEIPEGRTNVDSNGLETPETEVCFGMVSHPHISGSFVADPTCLSQIGPITLKIDDFQTSLHPRKRIHVQDHLKIDADGNARVGTHGPDVGTIPKRMGEILQVLDNHHKIRLQLRAIIKAIDDPKNKQKQGQDHKCVAQFYAIVYGPFGESEVVGGFLEKYDVCLQTPQGCDTNRRYRNPHALTGRDHDARYTNDLDLVAQRAPLRAWEGTSNYLDGMEFPEEVEAKNPSAIQTPLYPHQRQALSFMLQREKGWMLDGGEMKTDVWEQILVSGVRMYRNTINDEEQLEPPPDFRGGILADEMGLGKTLTIAALIASDRDAESPVRRPSLPSSGLSHTLIIVPPTLLPTWENELKKHCSSGMMHWDRHHKANKFTQHSQLDTLDIVLTTYNTVCQEWQDRHKSPSILFRVHWHRIVLDEAHLIRNIQTKTAEAVCALHASRRWAVTGTPIQNHVTDFVALLQFLRVAPYDCPADFERDIVQLWKVNEDEAISRLKRLITYIGLRRTRDNIELPSRVTYDQPLHFNARERQLYNGVEALVDSMVAQRNAAEQPNRPDIHTLQGVNALRLICNFGVLTDLRAFSSQQLASLQWGPQEAQHAFNALLAMDATKCMHCRGDTAVSKEASLDILESNAAWEHQRQPEISRCGLVICGSCALAMNDISWCGHNHCASYPVSTQEKAVELTPSVREPSSVEDLPSKIQALVNDLIKHPDSKAVVFSDWRKTLDLAARALDFCAIPYVRYDGTMTERERVAALSRFSNDPQVKVILFTIRCGAVGLDLTAADRAYLMEPQWNPTLEDQAFARVHRMGQKRSVTAIRFVMADSYEQQIVMLQGRKKTFADMALSPKKSPSSGRSSYDHLKALLA